MFAIIETGGKQYRVRPGDTIDVERLASEPGTTLDLSRVLMVGGDGEQSKVGGPTVPGAVVTAEVLQHLRGDKIVVFKFKAKVRYRRKTGHRQELTRLRITDIAVDGKGRSKKNATPASSEEPAPAEAAASAAAES